MTEISWESVFFIVVWIHFLNLALNNAQFDKYF